MTTPERAERALPEIVGRDTFDALAIRTDFGDDETWNAVVDELSRPWGPFGIHTNLTLGTTDFTEFATTASAEPAQVLRPA
ncbi:MULTISPECIES: hypothetical protein [unclassified Streptomyces]|uniref:hypothetical protein n=1 Tax=unclassified Streptomyces TaxID=2593676 RepID=UPI0033BF57CF